MTIISELNELTNKLDLWLKTKENALIAIENYKSETLSFDFPDLKIQKEDFRLERKEQSLKFWKNGNEIFSLRTTYDIKLETETNILSGYYSLDVNEKGEIIDDWFVLNESNVG